MNAELIAHLETATEPLFVARTGRLRWADESWHRAQFARDPGRYALLGLVPGVRSEQRARILLQLLGSSWAGLDDEARSTVDRVARVLVLGLPAATVLTVLLTLRHRRVNHKHVTRTAVRLLAEHPGAGTLMGTHRRALVAALEHALGKATARGCARELLDGPGGAHTRRALGRFTADAALAEARFRTLYAAGSAIVDVTDPTDATDVVEPPAMVDLDLDGDRPATVTATNRGDVAATLVHLYRGGAAPQLRSALDGYVERLATASPAYPGTLALVLDRSASMRGYGDREWAVLSQAEALRLMCERRCDRLVVVPVGGDGEHPGGATDLATGVLDALACGPDLVAVVSDGYENVYPGDLARVTATLPRAGVRVPVVFCHSAYGHSDDLTLRRPAPALPQRAFWHEADLGPLLLWLLAHTDTARADRALTEALDRRLSRVEDRLSRKE